MGREVFPLLMHGDAGLADKCTTVTTVTLRFVFFAFFAFYFGLFDLFEGIAHVEEVVDVESGLKLGNSTLGWSCCSVAVRASEASAISRHEPLEASRTEDVEAGEDLRVSVGVEANGARELIG